MGIKYYGKSYAIYSTCERYACQGERGYDCRLKNVISSLLAKNLLKLIIDKMKFTR